MQNVMNMNSDNIFTLWLGTIYWMKNLFFQNLSLDLEKLIYLKLLEQINNGIK